MRWPAKVVAAVHERSGGVCEGCGQRPATNIHHRKYASRGGKSEIVNALHLCGMGNVLGAGCHGIAHSTEGHEMGWSIHSWGDPETEPVLYRGVMRRLDF